MEADCRDGGKLEPDAHCGVQHVRGRGIGRGRGGKEGREGGREGGKKENLKLGYFYRNCLRVIPPVFRFISHMSIGKKKRKTNLNISFILKGFCTLLKMLLCYREKYSPLTFNKFILLKIASL